jgi:type IX secretion system PorP/SprF family membrane protein
MKKVVQLSVALSFLLLGRAVAQDFHLSQYDAFPLYMNPALTGNYLGEDGDYKIHSVYRTQWRALASKPFSTFGMGYDMKYDRYGMGGYILNNRSGAGNFNTMNVQLAGSYFITDPKTSPHLLNTGLEMGIFYKSFNPTKLLFESQYDNSTGTLNSDISNGENFQRTSMVKFDASLGVFYKYRDAGKKFWPYIGLSVFHLSRPKENFTDESSRLPMRFTVQSGCDFKINEDIRVTPTILYMNQAKASELNFGALLYYRISESKEKKVKYDLVGGLNYRTGDAFIVQLGLKKDNFVLRMSYDINTSYLNAYSNGRGGFEITLQITGKKGEPLFKSMGMF